MKSLFLCFYISILTSCGFAEEDLNSDPFLFGFSSVPNWSGFAKPIDEAEPFKLVYSYECGGGTKCIIEHLHKKGADIFRQYFVKFGHRELDQILLITGGLNLMCNSEGEVTVSRDKSKISFLASFFSNSPLLGVDWYLNEKNYIDQLVEGSPQPTVARTKVEYSDQGIPSVFWLSGYKIAEFGEARELVKGVWVPSYLSSNEDIRCVVDFAKSGPLQNIEDSMFEIPQGLATAVRDLDAGTSVQLK